jgi:hypothetical protein
MWLALWQFTYICIHECKKSTIWQHFNKLTNIKMMFYVSCPQKPFNCLILVMFFHVFKWQFKIFGIFSGLTCLERHKLSWIFLLFSSNLFGLWFVVFNATFNNISSLSWLSVLLVEEIGVPGENHWLVASHWQTLSHNVVTSTPRHELGSNSQL